MSELEVAWLAGLFEGEATFGYAGYRRGVPAIRITLAMSDKDVVQRAWEIIGSGSFNPNSPKYSKKFPLAKPMFVYAIAAQNDCKLLMQKLLPHMGLRRSERLEELIQYIEENPSRWNRGEGGEHGSSRRCRKCNCSLCSAEKQRLYVRSLEYEKERRAKRAKDVH